MGDYTPNEIVDIIRIVLDETDNNYSAAA